MNVSINGQNLAAHIKGLLFYVAVAALIAAVAKVTGWQVPLVYGSATELCAVSAVAAFLGK